MPRLVLLLTVFASLMQAARPPAAPPTLPPMSGLTVDVTLPSISRHVYSPENLPKHVRFTDREAGVCSTIFSCSARFRARWTEENGRPSTAVISDIAITTSVDIQIHVRQDSPADVLAHEETHRRISEYYYARAGEVARRAAAPLIGRKVPFKRGTPTPEPAMEPLEQELIAAFMWETSARSSYAQARFDEITDHGRNPITNAVAMERALREEAAHWAKVKDQTPPRKQYQVTSERSESTR